MLNLLWFWIACSLVKLIVVEKTMAWIGERSSVYIHTHTYILNWCSNFISYIFLIPNSNSFAASWDLQAYDSPQIQAQSRSGLAFLFFFHVPCTSLSSLCIYIKLLFYILDKHPTYPSQWRHQPLPLPNPPHKPPPPHLLYHLLLQTSLTLSPSNSIMWIWQETQIASRPIGPWKLASWAHWHLVQQKYELHKATLGRCDN